MGWYQQCRHVKVRLQLATHPQSLGHHGRSPSQEHQAQEMNFTHSTMLAKQEHSSTRQITLPPYRGPINSMHTMSGQLSRSTGNRRDPTLGADKLAHLDTARHERRQSQTRGNRDTGKVLYGSGTTFGHECDGCVESCEAGEAARGEEEEGEDVERESETESVCKSGGRDAE